MRRYLILVLGFFIVLGLGIWRYALAKEFTIGTLGFKDYDGYYYFLDLENLSETYLGVATDFEQIQISFSLDDGAYSFENRYVITLADENKDEIYDSLTGLYFSSYDYDSNTYYDGEGIFSLPSGKSILNLIVDLYGDPYNSALLQDSTLYIKDIELSFEFNLSNFIYTENGVDYIFSGTISYNGTFLDDKWYAISGLTSWSQPITVDIPGMPLGGQPIPEPATLMLVGFGLIGIVYAKSHLRRG